MKCDILTLDNKKAGSVDLADGVFGAEVRKDIIARMVNYQLAKRRSGNHKTKNVSEIRGTTAKPWNQKGTGRARAGTIRSPIWRGGGQTFAARPDRNHSQKLNKKMYRAAMRSILSELARQERLVVVNDFDLDAPKTKNLISKLSDLGMSDVLIVSEAVSDNLYLSSRNLHKVDVRVAGAVDPVSLLRHEKVLVTVPALKQFEELLG